MVIYNHQETAIQFTSKAASANHRPTGHSQQQPRKVSEGSATRILKKEVKNMKHLFFISCGTDRRYIELTQQQVFEVLRDGYTVTLIK